ncbi:MlaD family protein [Marinilabilia salmonicolor]|jgi:phospholipid/cholesterol/gamma-HCH transport system substrate-binding protein|uniref:Phospholipid/cholesterol/gamma-HCH transport system substrate-binding protein n=1 Tax=Marinilabilia salmonicolor TaxID=989 RepID=A0A2T0XH54_9BACT|nr:MlaD family protein [Marinilabilia salmonicolor]PRY98251.1 phospholipid/cholesterol/gamma-HCH transport system substrate-binding protein [Marinilabilia salmonicolor]RCW29215.1 phospholipid/cholesterol/gamma-HCH transport system substrate-binding protein [Marinilabilia salmonicolor]
MIKLKKEYKIAVTVIVALVILIWGLSFLKGKNIFNSGDLYYGVYSRIDGLTEASPIHYHGYKVGSVMEIQFYPDREDRFVVVFSLEKEMALNENTLAQIYNFDLMGAKAVRFVDKGAGAVLMPGDTLKTDIEGGLSAELAPIKNKVENLVVRMDSTLNSLSGVFSNDNNESLEEGMKSFRAMMKNLEQTTATVNASLGNGGALNSTLANIDSVTGQLARQQDNIAATMENVAGFSNQLAQVHLDSLVAGVDSSLTLVNTLLKQAQEGEGSLGLLLSDEGLYYNLMDASANLDRLLADIRHNPGRYLSISAVDFGKDVYLNVSDERAEQQGIVYKVEVASSNEPLDIKNQMVKEKHRIFEDTNGQKYTYTIGHSSSYAEIKGIRDEIIHQFPDAEVVAFKDGKAIRLIKALRQTGE